MALFEDVTLAEIFGSDSFSERIVFDDGRNTVRYTTAIPEPSSSVLLGSLFLLAACVTRFRGGHSPDVSPFR
ncbi:MAG: hypothetical protein AAF664_08650 [Planctomycetota bacterium]